MAIDPEQFSELMNALQTAVLLVARLEPDAQQSARDAGTLRATVERAAHAAQQLRTTNSDQA
jgi:hypothetical protein